MRTALAAGAPLILDSDAHEPQDLLTPAFARAVLLGAALPESELQTVLWPTPRPSWPAGPPARLEVDTRATHAAARAGGRGGGDVGRPVTF